MEIYSAVETAASRRTPLAPRVMVFITTRRSPAPFQRVGFDNCAIFLERGSSPLQHKLAQSLLPSKFWVKTFLTLVQSRWQTPFLSYVGERTPLLLPRWACSGGSQRWAPTTLCFSSTSGDTALTLPSLSSPAPSSSCRGLKCKDSGRMGLEPRRD